jgi:hypothetical protein
MVGVLVVHTMDKNPASWRVLKATDAQCRQSVLKPLRAIKTTMGKKSVVAGSDSHGSEDVVTHGKKKESPP